MRWYRDGVPLPSVLLHDHLDGGLRAATVIELARDKGYAGLPHDSVGELERWFDQSGSGSLERYLRAFDHTIAVMQSPHAIERVAFEAAEDLASDGVIYAEIRFCPLLHVDEGMRPGEVIEAVARGMSRGQESTGLEWGLIVDSLRHLHDSLEMAKIAVEGMGSGVVGFDLAGPEAGYPPSDHAAGFELARSAGLGISIHAGESAGADAIGYIRDSIEVLGAHRIGHGVEIVDDCRLIDGAVVEVGPVADMVRKERIPLEMCPASNMATSGLTPSGHPFGPLYRAGFNVTLSTDNRLMSSTSMSDEYEFATEWAGLEIDDLAEVARASLEAAFCDDEAKSSLWAEQLVPGFSEAGVQIDGDWRR